MEGKKYMTVGEAGKRGGSSTLKKHGRDHYVRIGSIGGKKSKGGGRPRKLAV